MTLGWAGSPHNVGRKSPDSYKWQALRGVGSSLEPCVEQESERIAGSSVKLLGAREPALLGRNGLLVGGRTGRDLLRGLSILGTSVGMQAGYHCD